MASPLELLTAKENQEPPLFSKLYGPIICGGIAFVITCFANAASKKPVFSGIQKHIGATGVGVLIGLYAEKHREGYYAERDAVLRHYVELHPEDFPTPVRQKYGEILDPWIPVR